MVQDPRAPKDNGRLKLPKVTAGMNRVPIMVKDKGGKGGKDDAKDIMLGQEKDEQEDQKILAKARKHFETAASAESENRAAGLEDLKFKAGDQWPATIAAQRNNDFRPCMTINKIPTFVNQVVNEQRNNRPAINVSPVGDKSDPEVAKMYRGLIRYFERESHADVAYDTAFDSAASIGWGYWRMVTEYESPDSMDQTIVIKRIRNTFSVYVDPTSQEPDTSDKRFAFITELIPRGEFEETYPDADPMSWTESAAGDTYKNWIDEKNVRVAEYFLITYKTKELVQLSNGHVGFREDLSDEVDAAIKSGKLKVLKERDAEVPTVMWYKLTAVEILERREWAGKWIPIFRVVGNEIDIEGKLKLSGIIRNAKDAQRSYNYSSPLALDTPIPTPSGWTTMLDIAAGDRVFDETGAVVDVVGTSPVLLHRDCFRVEFDDGSSIVADKDHLWTVEERTNMKEGRRDWKTKTVPTAELNPKIQFILSPKPLDMPDADLPIDPYFLGWWLGDGTSRDIELTPGDMDVEEVRDILIARGLHVGEARKYGEKASKLSAFGIRKHFARLGLIRNKHIPAIYQRASRQQRLDLLRGLMDSDGNVTKFRQCAFTTTIPALSEGFSELLRGLGIKVAIQKIAPRLAAFPGGNLCQCISVDRFFFSCGPDDSVFGLSRKKARQTGGGPTHWRRTKRFGIVSVTAVPSVPVKCIKVGNDSHLFLAGYSMIPTHNTMEMETIALAPKAPFVGAEGQFEGHEDKWNNANTKSYAYLEYQPRTLAGQPLPAPQRQPPSMPSAGWESLKQSAAQDMMATTGIRFDSTKQERVTDESGRALRELRQTSDMGSFHYMDNLCRTLKHQGDVFIDLIPKVIDTRRMITILREDGGEEQVMLDPHAPKAFDQKPDPKTGKMQKIFNPTMGRYGVTVTIGPSFATKRIEAAESMMAFVRALPQTAAVVADLIAKNQDWPEAEQIAARLAKTLPPHLLAPDMKDVTPQVAALLQSMDGQIKDLTMKLQAAAMALKDKGADRAVDLEKIHLDFEAKVLGVVQKAEASFNAHVGSQIQELGQNVTGLVKQLSSGKVEDAAGQALAALHQSAQIVPPMTQQQPTPTGPAPSAGMQPAAPPQAPMPPR
jgi:hypothetical protein